MSQENVEVVRRIYDEYVARPEAVRELYPPDYETDVTDVAPDFDVIRGFDAALEALRSYMETFEDFYIELEEEIHADEEHVVVEVRDGGRMPGSDSRSEIIASTSMPSVTARSFASPLTSTRTAPSKPPGCRTRAPRPSGRSKPKPRGRLASPL